MDIAQPLWFDLRHHWGVLAWALLLGHLVAWLSPRWTARNGRSAWVARAVLAAVVVALSLSIPLKGVSVAGWLAGWFSDPSALTMAMCLSAWVMRYRSMHGVSAISPVRMSPLRDVVFWVGVAATGWLLWISVLWYLPIDPYRAGFHPTLMLSLPLALWCWCLPWRWRLCVVAALLAWVFRLQASSNLWDYLCDLPLGLYATARMVHTLYRRCKTRRWWSSQNAVRAA